MPNRLQGAGEPQIFDTLKLTDDQWYECVSEMDRAASKSKLNSESLEAERVAYRNLDHIVVSVQGHEGHRLYYKVRPYDISTSGIGFLHGSYIHVGTKIELELKHHELGMTTMRGEVRCCDHVQGRIHLVDASFNESIELDGYLLA